MSSNTHRYDGDSIIFEEDMVLNRHNGIMSIRYMNDYLERELDEDDRIVRVSIKVHNNFFDPITTKIEIPESMFENTVTGETTEIEIPVKNEVTLTQKDKIVISGLSNILDKIKVTFKNIINNGE
jgi:hypothetical protein